MKKKNILNNPVEKYFEENKFKKLSVKTLKKKLNLNKISTVYYYAINGKNIELVTPINIGSQKKKLYVFEYKN